MSEFLKLPSFLYTAVYECPFGSFSLNAITFIISSPQWIFKFFIFFFVFNTWLLFRYKFPSINCYSKRFAAKEAFVKALGIGFRKNINFKDIEVVNNTYGKPYISINTKIANKIKTLFKVKKFNILLSISDEKKHSIASVIISKQWK